MKKFVFELQEILDIRKFEQQQAEIELGKALAVEKGIQDKLDALAQQQVTTARLLKGSTNFEDIANAQKFYSFIRTQTEYLMKQMAEAKIVSDQKREILKSCMQKTDALEQLKGTQEEEFRTEMKKQEAKQIDDMVNSRFKKPDSD